MTKALVVYESMFGNTEAIARAVGEGLSALMTVDVRHVSESTTDLENQVDLIVAGGPTHAFSMSRPSTRADAVKQGAAAGRSTTGLREWLEVVNLGTQETPVATFDTRVDKVRRLPGSAARKALRVARGHGLRTLGSESFYVRDTKGPLLDGEVERATEWGHRLGAELDTGHMV
jgi:flavodoxin